MFLVLAIAVGLSACSTLSEAARTAGIQTTTSTRVVAGHPFIASWDADYDIAYDGPSVAALEADSLAKEGWHDVWVLAEQYEPPVAFHMKAGFGTRVTSVEFGQRPGAGPVRWRISVYGKGTGDNLGRRRTF